MPVRRLLASAAAVAVLLAVIGTLPPGRADGDALHPPRVEQWRPLVEQYWGAAGYGDEVEYALMILHAESTGVPTAVNPRSNASGLFQHLPKYWEERSRAAGWAGADIFDPEANVAVAAWLRATSPRYGWRHWEPTHHRYPVGSWGPSTRWDAAAGRYVGVGGGTPSTGGAFVEPGPRLGISVTKAALEPAVPAGDRIDWTYTVANTGEAHLWAVYLWDDALHEISCPGDDLAPGESMECRASQTALPGDHSERVLAFAWGEDGREVEAEADGGYTGITPAGAPPPAALELRTASAPWPSPDGPGAVRTYRLHNAGTVDLWAAYVWDDDLGEIACPHRDLSPGESVLCSTAATAAGPFRATAWAWTDAGIQVEAPGAAIDPSH